MGLFGKKKEKKSRFGRNIKPDCGYCAYKAHSGDEICASGITPINGSCKKFLYNPLLREPREAVKLGKNEYSEKDFSLK